MTTTSPRLTARTSAPTSSTTPMPSGPIDCPVSLRSIDQYGQRSLPQMQARVTRTSASVGSRMAASGTSSMRTSPAACMTVALMGPHGSTDRRPSRDPARGVPAGSPSRRRAALRWDAVETRAEIREFLTSRRARITPEQVGLPDYGLRRVPGLRREEVAVLAGVSAPYYTRIERGDMSGASDSVLEALARALQLDDAERAHLFDLARAAQPGPAAPRRRKARQNVRPEVQWTLDAITGAAAFVSNERLDVLAANQLGRALFSEVYAAPTRPVNTARFVFL